MIWRHFLPIRKAAVARSSVPSFPYGRTPPTLFPAAVLGTHSPPFESFLRTFSCLCFKSEYPESRSRSLILDLQSHTYHGRTRRRVINDSNFHYWPAPVFDKRTTAISFRCQIRCHRLPPCLRTPDWIHWPL